MTKDGTLTGTYRFEHGKFEPDEGMRAIEAKLVGLKLLAGSTSRAAGEFYLDPGDGKYWHFIEAEDYSARLIPTTRSHIEANYPYVNCDKLLDVER